MNALDKDDSNPNTSSGKRVKKSVYEKELFRMQLELVKNAGMGEKQWSESSCYI